MSISTNATVLERHGYKLDQIEFPDLVIPVLSESQRHYEQAALHGGQRIMHAKFCIVSDRHPHASRTRVAGQGEKSPVRGGESQGQQRHPSPGRPVHTRPTEPWERHQGCTGLVPRVRQRYMAELRIGRLLRRPAPRRGGCSVNPFDVPTLTNGGFLLIVILIAGVLLLVQLRGEQE